MTVGGPRRIALAALAVLIAVPVSAKAPLDWRQVATLRDRQRLREWRSAWMTALHQAREGGAGAAIAADPALFAADGALVDGANPPAGDYRCRHIAIGTRSVGPVLMAGEWGRCRIEGAALPLSLAGFDGIQRPVGTIYADSDRRAIFLGTSMIGDEHRAGGYGHAEGRDMAGVIERIGERRWRLAVPYPYFGAPLELIELVPA